MKRTTRLLVTLAAVIFLLNAPAPAAAFPQKQQEADKQAAAGAAHLQRGNWRGAADSFRKALRANPNHVEASYGLGVAQMNLKQYQDALGAFSKVIELKPNARVQDALRGSGLIFFDQQRYKEVTDVFEHAKQWGQLTPSDYYFLGKSYAHMNRAAEALAAMKLAAPPPQQFAHDAYFTLGFLLLTQNEGREAAAPLEQAAQLQPNHAPTLMLLGNAYLVREKFQDAHDVLRRAASIDPNQFFTHYGLGYALMNLNRAEEAVGSFTAAMRLQPQSPEAHVGMGNARLRLNQFKEAQGSFEQALRLKPDSADALLGMCVVYYSQGDYPALLDASEQAVRLAPSYANAHTMRGAALATVGQMREGLAAVRRAAQLEPENYWPHHVIAFIHVREDRPQEALPEARRGVSLKPEYPETQNLLSYVLNQLGQHQEALTAAQAALRLKREPADEGWAHYNIATALEKLNRREEALAAYRQSVAAYNQVGRTLDPDDLYLMGNAYLRLDQDRQAIMAFRQSIRVRPSFAQARYNLGVAYFAAGDRKSAMAEYNELKRLDAAKAARLLKVIGGR